MEVKKKEAVEYVFKFNVYTLSVTVSSNSVGNKSWVVSLSNEKDYNASVAGVSTLPLTNNGIVVFAVMQFIASLLAQQQNPEVLNIIPAIIDYFGNLMNSLTANK